MVGIKTGFPSELFNRKTTVLSLFSAAFYGENDVQHIHKAGVKSCILVDTDRHRLTATAEMYRYTKICADAFTLIDSFNLIRSKFDIVVADPYTGVKMARTYDYLPKLLNIASNYLIIGCTTEYLNDTDTFYFRSNHSGGIYWRVICK